MTITGFYIGAIVCCNGQYGAVVKSTDDWDVPGVVRWDTNNEKDFGDWRGLFGSFRDIGGQIIDQPYAFSFITKDGSLI